jgi:hypothetical protein
LAKQKKRRGKVAGKDVKKPEKTEKATGDFAPAACASTPLRNKKMPRRIASKHIFFCKKEH